tara:strand:- start:9568 stop:10455 length:888 start_codon:yes stop_codon:yes gene_type:complete
MVNNRIAIGGVQFGLPYGVANTSFKEANDSDISNILTYAKSLGINTIDTSISYGESERKLGDYGVSDCQIITKLPAIPKDCPNILSWVERQLMESLLRLRLPRIYGLLLHNPQDLSSSKGEELWDAMQFLQKKKLVHKIGYSIYKPEDLDTFYDLFFPDIVQAPYSILDRRLASSGWLDRLFNASTEIHVRSVFLQGLLLMKKNQRPKKFDRWLNVFEKFDLWLKENNLTAMQALVSFSMNDSRITKVIVGVDNMDQLEEIVASLKIKIQYFPEDLVVKDLNLIDPSRWNLLEGV